MRKLIFPIVLLALLASCSGNKNDADAYGNFEADEVIISAENSGKILATPVAEGDQVLAGVMMALIDTTNLSLQKKQLVSQAINFSQIGNIDAQIAVSDQQISNLNKDVSRIKKMFVEGAATQKQLDDITGQIDLVKKQKGAYASQLNSIQKQADAVEAQIKVLDDRMSASVVKAPINGTVLERYCEPGELAVPGKAMFKMANIESLNLRAYISETQLAEVKIGQEVKVLIDKGDISKQLSGKIQWIASQAEFTPKIIQTKEERVKLVYAIKVGVKNDGSLKIGMPAEIIF
jgi:HlyD family secretion protein